MASNKRKILESARKLAQKGAKEKALKEYQKLLKLDPKDAKLRLEIGDAFRRWGQAGEAVDTYTRVAEQYMAEGFDARAVAVFKQIQNLAPDRLEAYAPLAELYERMGLTAEAINALQTAADGYHRQGKKSEALDLLRKMANIDPANTTSRIKVADLLRQEGQKDDAVSEYKLVAAELERQGDREALGTVYRRILELDETNVPALAALAQNLAHRGKVAEAVPIAERALQLDADTVERYESLAALYESTGRETERAGILRAMAELHRRRGDEDRARGILQRLAPARELSSPRDEMSPQDELRGADLLDGDGEALFGDEFPDGGLEPAVDFGSEGTIDADSFSRKAARPSVHAGGRSPLGGPGAPAPHAEPPNEFDLEQLLAEASVYLRYGKRDKAIAHLERVIESDPEHRVALEKLGEAFAECGEDERAVEVWIRAAKRASEEDDAGAVAVLRGRIAALDAAAVAGLDVAAGAAAPDRDDADIELDLGADDEDLIPEDELLIEDDDAAADGPSAGRTPAESGSAAPTARAGEPIGANDLSAEAAAAVLEDLEEADFYMQQGLLDEAQQIYQRVLTIAPNHPRALARLGEVASARGGRSAAPPLAQPRSADVGPAPVPEPEVGAIPDEIVIEDELLGADADSVGPEDAEPLVEEQEHISFDFVTDELDHPESPAAESEDLGELSDLDLHDEATLSDGEAESDGSDTEEFEPRLDSPDGAVSKAPPAGAVAAPAPDEGDFDLRAALADAFDDDPGLAPASAGSASNDAFEAVFDAFKKGVKETLSEGDHQAHYDLAIAYKEMGLHNDAIHELRVAMGDPGRTAECLHLIGLCAIDADQAPLAVEHLEQLLMLPELPVEASVAGRFDLGRALEALGDTAGARREWEAVAAVRPDFRNLRERLANLDESKPETPEDAGVFAERSDDGDPARPEAVAAYPGETFDDLIAEANAEVDTEVDAVPGAGSIPPPPRPDPNPPARRKKKISFV